jgi:hypothetical protein
MSSGLQKLANCPIAAESLSPLLEAELAKADARDQRKLDLLRMMQHVNLLRRFRPESIVQEFFGAARLRTAGPTPRHVPTDWPELMAGLDSAPCIAIRRLLDSDVIVTLPGFTPATSAACLAGCRRMRQRRCAPLLFAPFLFCVIFIITCAAECISRRRFQSMSCPTLWKNSSSWACRS